MTRADDPPTSNQDPAYSGSSTVSVVSPSDFFYDFNTGVSSVWSPARSGTTPSGVKFLGNFQNKEVATLTLDNLTTHSNVEVKFDLYVIGAWTGITGNSPFVVTVDGTSAFSYTFSNVSGDNQSYPDGTSNPPGTGSTAQNSLGYTHSPAILYNDTVYHIDCKTAHSASSVAIAFSSNLPGAITDMSWGLKNVEVIANP